MSTRIHNGLRFKTNNLLEIHNYMMELREEAKPIIYNHFAKLFAEEAVHVLDMFSVFGLDHFDKDQQNYSPVFKTWCNMQERIAKVKSSSLRDPLVDTEFNICIIPIKDSAVLAIPYTENRDLMKLLLSKSYIEYFGYWDNADPDVGCDDEEWEIRRKLWDDALGYSGRPALNGFNADISFLEIPHVSTNDIIDNLPTFESRLNTMAEELCYNNFANNNNRDMTPPDAYRAFRKYKKTDDGMKDMEKCKVHVDTLLIKDVTGKLLTTDLNKMK